MRNSTIESNKELKVNNGLFRSLLRQILGVLSYFSTPVFPNKDRLLRHSCNFPVVSELVNCGWYITSWWLGWVQEQFAKRGAIRYSTVRHDITYRRKLQKWKNKILYVRIIVFHFERYRASHKKNEIYRAHFSRNENKFFVLNKLLGKWRKMLRWITNSVCSRAYTNRTEFLCVTVGSSWIIWIIYI